MNVKLSALLLLPFAAIAQDGQESLITQSLPSSYLLKLTVTLFFIVVMIFGIAWVLKRFNLTQQKGSGMIKVIGGMALGTKDRLMVIEIGEERLLLGLSPGRIEKLHTLNCPPSVPNTDTSFSDQIDSLKDS
ncbi:MAG: flagellar protein FliO/FliZ [Gammaproteobacteria bacterium]|jgi:flagellar protein FliO/FliZ